jgi:Domain of unknown function (DUF4249)
MRYFIFFLILFFSCSKEKKITLLESKKKIVVNCIFNPYKNWDVQVLFSNTPYSTNITSKVINNALVLITNNNNIADTLTYSNGYSYKSNNKPIAGIIYKIIVVVPGFDTISASDIIPKYPLSNISLKILDSSNTTNYKKVNGLFVEQLSNLEFKYFDNPNENNFYKITIKEYSTAYFLLSANFIDSLFTFRELLTDDPKIYTALGNTICLFDDTYINGQSFTSNLYYYHDANYIGRIKNDVTFPPQPYSDYRGIYVVSIHSMSNELFKYQNAYISQNIGSGDIFGEFKNSYSNIKNGLGIFAGESVNTIKVN